MITSGVRFVMLAVLGCVACVLGPALRAQSTTSDGGPVAVALAEVRDHGWAPRVIRTSDAVVYPFCHAEPELTCAPLHACYVALEPGERVTGIARGDAVRWKLDTLAQGGDQPRTLLVVKPTACNVTTNLLVATDRRVYDIALQSPPCEGHAGVVGAPSVRNVAFYYPDAVSRGRADTATVGSTAGMQVSPASAPVLQPAPPERLNFGYTWHAAKAVPWAPEQIYDDSAHVYIRLPDAARFSAAPALWEIQPDGSRSLLNYTLRDGTYKTDRLFDRAILSLGSGHNERSIEVMNARWHPDR
jgi:P-type conjugative transfer protein TrbG